MQKDHARFHVLEIEPEGSEEAGAAPLVGLPESLPTTSAARAASKPRVAILFPGRMWTCALLSIVVLMAATWGLFLASGVNGRQEKEAEPRGFLEVDFGGRPHTATGKGGAVATDAWECSRIGANLLAQGGNAVDAVGERIVPLSSS